MAFDARQYEAPQPYFGAADGNVTHLMDKMRLQSYDLYEGIFRNSPVSLKIVLRGDDALPVYVPSGKKIIRAIDQYLGKDMDYLVEADNLDDEPLDEGTRIVLEQYLKSFYKREKMKAKFASSKMWGCVRADAGFLITADPNAEAGKRISVHEVNPRQVFAIDNKFKANSIAGYHLVERVFDFRETDAKSTKEICKRQTWRREQEDDGNFTGVITHEITHWEIGKWDDRYGDELEKIPAPQNGDMDVAPLPAEIRALPIYMWHMDTPMGSDWGTSLLSGLETLIFAINQSITDEDLTLIMQGIGMFVTNAAPPIDATGNITSWNVGPGQVLEVGTDQKFENVAGVSTVSPYQDHMTFIDEKGLAESSGTPSVAIGRVDVTVAESGISLELQMAPLLAANETRELELYTVLDQFHHDLVNMWIPAYEGIQTNRASVVTVFADPMPVNKAQIVQDVVLLQQSNLILTSMAVDKLSEIGWKYPPEMTVDQIVEALTQQAKDAAAALDPYGASMAGSGDGETDEFGNPIEPPPDEQTINLGVTT